MGKQTVPPCPVCGEKLPHDRKPQITEHETVRFRHCACGYARLERITVVIDEYFPESTPVPTITHPGEGGM